MKPEGIYTVPKISVRTFPPKKSSPGRDAFLSRLGVSGSELCSSFGELNGVESLDESRLIRTPTLSPEDRLIGFDSGLASPRMSSMDSSGGDGNIAGLSFVFPDRSNSVRPGPYRPPSGIAFMRPSSGRE
jgi:hypothetical protein